jgi:hypothetical protein
MRKFHFISVLFLVQILLPEKSFSQDILYKKDSSVLKVNILDFDANIIRYKIPEDSLNHTFYLDLSEVDSLTYYNGESLDFTFNKANDELSPKQINRNYLSIELFNTITRKPYLIYERLSKTGHTGFEIGFLYNFNSRDDAFDYWWGHRYTVYYDHSPHIFFSRVGMNIYPFNYSLAKRRSIRILTGSALLIGSFLKSEDTYEYSNDTHPVFAASLMWNIRSRFYIGNNFQITGGIELSVLPFLTFFCPQIGLSASF